MASTTIAFGLLMIGLGVGGYLLTGRHPTALIPAGVGVVFVVLGALARNDRLRKQLPEGPREVELPVKFGARDHPVHRILI